MHFQNGSLTVISHEDVCDPCGGRVHRAADIYSERPASDTSGVLDGRENAGLFEKNAHLMNLTESPGRRNVGSCALGVNISMWVRPMICHPPGDSSE